MFSSNAATTESKKWGKSIKKTKKNKFWNRLKLCRAYIVVQGLGLIALDISSV